MRFPLRWSLLDEDPIEYNFRLLMVNGFWPIETKNRTAQILFSIYSFLCAFSPISMLFIQVLDLYLLRNDIITLTKNLCASSVTFASVAKYLLEFLHVDKIMKLHRKLDRHRTSRTAPEEVKAFKEADRILSLTTKAIYCLGLPVIAAWMLYPGLEARDKQAVPFPYRLPIDDWSTPVYEILYTYQSMSMIGFMVVVLSTDLIYYGLVVRINAKYDILMERLKSLEALVEPDSEDENEGRLRFGQYDPNHTEKAMLIVKESSIYHKDILEDIDELKLIYSNAYFVHILAAVTLVGSIIMDIVVVSKGVRFQMLQRVMYSTAGIADTFLICFFTDSMQERSYKLMRSIYTLPWYKMHPKVRQDLLMISMRAAKPSAVRISNFFPLNLATFLQFLKLTYNITALLYQTIKK